MQTELNLKNTFTKKQMALILIGAAVAGLLTAWVIVMIPSEMEAKALTILSNQEEWWGKQSLITASEADIAQWKADQAALSQENSQLRMEVETQLAGF